MRARLARPRRGRVRTVHPLLGYVICLGVGVVTGWAAKAATVRPLGERVTHLERRLDELLRRFD
jgi:hypothetical protein